MRSWLLPGVIAGLIQLARAIGDGPNYYLPVIAGAFALLACVPAICCFFWFRRWYGLPGAERRGLKVADDAAGPPVDPTSLDRVVSPDAIRSAREYVRRRFPLLAAQPIVETRVCQYEFSPDGDFLLDRHPEASNVWLVGGGSGHGFKMGPALGEQVARMVLDGTPPEAPFTYAHFAEGRERVRGTSRRESTLVTLLGDGSAVTGRRLAGTGPRFAHGNRNRG